MRGLLGLFLAIGALACSGPNRAVQSAGAPQPIGPYSQAIARGEEPEFLIIGGNRELVNKVLRLLEEAQTTPRRSAQV